jgi:hypothetical protein
MATIEEVQDVAIKAVNSLKVGSILMEVNVAGFEVLFDGWEIYGTATFMGIPDKSWTAFVDKSLNLKRAEFGRRGKEEKVTPAPLPLPTIVNDPWIRPHPFPFGHDPWPKPYPTPGPWEPHPFPGRLPGEPEPFPWSRSGSFL